MTQRVEVVDTSILVDLLDIPNEAHDHQRRITEAEAKRKDGIQLLLPVAAVIEAGQHIQRLGEGLGRERRTCAQRLADVLDRTVRGMAPWNLTPLRWDADFLRSLLDPGLPYPLSLVESLARRTHEMGDLTIIAEVRRLRQNVPWATIDIWTLDAGLRAAVDSLPKTFRGPT